MNNDLIHGVAEYYGLQGLPNTAHYIAIYGPGAIMSVYDVKAPYKTPEEVYAACIKQGCTWKELLNFKGYDENVLL